MEPEIIEKLKRHRGLFMLKHLMDQTASKGFGENFPIWPRSVFSALSRLHSMKPGSKTTHVTFKRLQRKQCIV